MTTSYDVDDELDQLDPLEPEPLELPAEGSLLDTIRRRSEELAVAHEYDVELPGYGGLLALRLRPLRGEMHTKLRKRIEASRSPERDFELAADTLIAACEMVVARESTQVAFRSLTDEPVRIETRLAELLRVPPEITQGRGRELVRWLFCGAPDPELAAGIATGEFFEWCRGAESDLDGDLLGES